MNEKPTVRTRRWLHASTPACLAIALLLTVARTGCAQYRLYWGDVHGHTQNSDGKGTLDDYFQHARDSAHLDFVIVTDHDFGNGKPTWSMPASTWKQTQRKADEYTVDGRFVAIAGYEWTSQPKYWTGVQPGKVTERLFAGPPKYFNHKNVYFTRKVDYLFSAKDKRYMTPDLLAAAVRRAGGLVHNNHPCDGDDGRDQWEYSRDNESVIADTEIWSDVIRYQGKSYDANMETAVRKFLNSGRQTGFVRGSDTHDGTPSAHTAVLAKALTRRGVFEALRHRRNYAVSNARIVLDFRINGHLMGEKFETIKQPQLIINVKGTDRISEVAVIRNGKSIRTYAPQMRNVELTYRDNTFDGTAYYYVRVTQVDTDPHGNPSRAWSSPIWVKRALQSP